jgi:hypothetical protein
MSLSRTPSPPLPRKRGREQIARVAPMCVNLTGTWSDARASSTRAFELTCAGGGGYDRRTAFAPGATSAQRFAQLLRRA